MAEVLRESNPPNRSEAWCETEAPSRYINLVLRSLIWPGNGKERALFLRRLHEKHIAEGGQP